MPPSRPNTLTSSWRALAEARRLVPIGLVALALIVTEWMATGSPQATLTLTAFVVAFVLLVPATYRWVDGLGRAGPRRTLGLAAYAALNAVLVAATTWLVPRILHFESYVAHPPAATAILALAAIAGWVLARDIDLSAGLSVAVAQQDALARETQAARELALRQHLDPHFLFNTLGAIAEWCREDPQVAEQALLELSAMLRTLFDGIRTDTWPLSRELEVLLALHRLYELRDDERYRLHATLNPPAGARVPPLVLLPIFENALKHGSGEAPLTLFVGVVAEGEPSHEALRVELWNAGAFAGPRAGGTGLDTVTRRLQLAFGASAEMSIQADSRDGVAGTVARVTLPLESPPETPNEAAHV